MRQLDFVDDPVTEDECDRDSWRTPASLWEALDDEFHFTLDVAADDKNRKCLNYFTKGTDGILQGWASAAGGGAVWCNPPFSDIEPWCEKACHESMLGATVVMIVPGNRHEQPWWHRWVVGCAHEVRCLFGRVEYVPPPGAESPGAPFPSLVLVYRPGDPVATKMVSWP